MKAMITIMLALGFVSVAVAFDLGKQAPIKPESTFPPNIPVDRQGGDTIADAFVIPEDVVLPWSDTGTTAGYNDDYDAVCPSSGSKSPDVVYRYVPNAGIETIDVDLCNSSYDTKVYMYDASLNLIACNDDYYFNPPCYPYSSKLVNVAIAAGETYYIIVDGSWGAYGAYRIDINEHVPCEIVCPSGAFDEGEPPLHDQYVDEYNGGCFSPGNLAFQFLQTNAYHNDLTLCGFAGWYHVYGTSYRDTDWFLLESDGGDQIDVTVEAEFPTYFLELGPHDCDHFSVIHDVYANPCQVTSMAITGYSYGEIVWFCVASVMFDSPDGTVEYPYVCWFDGLAQPVIATEPTSWSTVKALFE